MELTIYDIFGYIWPFLQKYGWYLIGTFILFLYSKPHVEKFVYRRQQQTSLHQANDPTRVSLLREEMIRIREEQMRNHQQSIEEYKRKQQEKADKEKLDAAKKEEEATLQHYGSPGYKLGTGSSSSSASGTATTTTTHSSPGTSSSTVRSRPPGFFGGNSSTGRNSGSGAHRWGADRMRPKGG